MRQAGWIAFLLFTVGLVTYEATIDQSSAPATSDTSIVYQTDEGGGEIPPNNPK